MSPAAEPSLRSAVSPHGSHAPLLAHRQCRPGLHKDSDVVCQPAGPVSEMDTKQSWIQLQSRGRPSKTEIDRKSTRLNSSH